MPKGVASALIARMENVKVADAGVVVFNPIVRAGENVNQAGAAIVVSNPIARTLAAAVAEDVRNRLTDNNGSFKKSP